MRGPRAIALAAGAGLLLAATAGAAPKPTLAATTTAATLGRYVTLTARAAIPHGDRLQILGKRASQSKLYKIADCARSPCVGKWRETRTNRVAFVAALVGKQVVGQSKVIVVTWRAPAPPPPPPPPPVSSYVGPTGQTGKSLSFQVSSNGLTVTSLTIDFKASCNSGEDYESSATATPNAAVNPDRSFSFHLSGSGIQLQFDGKFDTINGTTAMGTFEIHTSHDGSECDTGTVTWSASRG